MAALRTVSALLVAVTGCGRFGFATIAPPASDAAGDSAGGSDAIDAAVPVYGDVTDPSLWSSFDLSAVSAGANGYVGAAFDGRYIYFVPYSNATYDGLVTRYDTQAAFTTAASWSTFDVATVNAQAKGFAGAVFDGRYMYFIPNYNGASDGIVMRLDTQASFTVPGSWSSFDTSTANAGLKGYQGGAFDGRYVYVSPWANTTFDGVAGRYDTLATFTAAASWTQFDASTVNAGSKGFYSATFDGRYVYYAPDYNGTFDGIATRYDTQASFTAGGSWSTFDTTALNAGANGFAGAVFDTRYVYLVPQYSGAVTRYDTLATFTASASWSVFDTTTVKPGAKGYFGGAFDGRYVYFIPFNNGAADGLVVRYDSVASFAAAASWSVFDTTTLNANAKGFHGAAFDGRYLYLVPSNGIVMRFDAKTPPSVPAGYSGSFF
jgi:hypothetical protein